MLMAIDESLFWDSVLDAAGIVITGPQMSQWWLLSDSFYNGKQRRVCEAPAACLPFLIILSIMWAETSHFEMSLKRKPFIFF